MKLQSPAKPSVNESQMYKRSLQFSDLSVTESCLLTKELRSDFIVSEKYNRILSIVQDALHASNLLHELSQFRSTPISNPSLVGYINQIPLSQKKSRLMLQLKDASCVFCDAFSTLAEKDLELLDDLKLRELVRRKTWMKLILEDCQNSENCQHAKNHKCGENHQPAKDNLTKTDQSNLDNVHSWLQAIYKYKPLQNSLETATPCIQSNTHIQIHRLKQSRESALFAFLSSTLAFVIAILFLLSAMPSISDSLQLWSSANSQKFKSIIAILLVLLTVLTFQLVTRITTPLQNDTLDKNTGTRASILGDLLNFDVSLRRMIAGCLGPLLIGCGTGFSASAGFGAFGITVLLDGIHQTYAISFWASQLALSIFCYAFAWKWAGIPLGLGTIPSVLLIGPAMSLAATMAPQNLSFTGNSAAFILGTLVLGFGIALSAAAALGPDARTAILLAAEKKHRWPIPRSSLFFNFSTILIGIVLNGNFGVATVLNLMLIPPLLARLVPALRQHLSE